MQQWTNIGRRLLPQNLNAHSISKRKFEEKVEQTKESGLAYSIPREASLWAEIIWSLHTSYTKLQVMRWHMGHLGDTVPRFWYCQENDSLKRKDFLHSLWWSWASLAKTAGKRHYSILIIYFAFTTLLDGAKQLDLHVRYWLHITLKSWWNFWRWSL